MVRQFGWDDGKSASMRLSVVNEKPQLMIHTLAMCVLATALTITFNVVVVEREHFPDCSQGRAAQLLIAHK